MRGLVLVAVLSLGTLATALPYRPDGMAWWQPSALQNPWSSSVPHQNTGQQEHHYDVFEDHGDDYSDEEDYEDQRMFGGHGLDRRISDDLRRFEEDLVLLRRLVEGHHQMGMVPMFHRPHAAPWYFPAIHVQPQAPEGDQWEEDTPQDGLFPGGDKGAGNPWFSFPSPANHPLIPAFPKPEDLPDNYDNSSHTVHVVNGSHVTVNTTTKKNTDDDFNSFFHHQVVHIRPQEPKEEGPTDEGDEGEQIPEEEYPEAMSTDPPFVYTFPQGSEEPPVEGEEVTDGPTFGFGTVPAEIRLSEVSAE